MSKIIDTVTKESDMSFQEKSNLVMTVMLVVAYGAYFASVIPSAVGGTPTLEGVQTSLFGAVVALVVGAAIGHAVIAGLAPDESDLVDERDRLITLRADARAGYVLGAGAVATLGVALLQQEMFWVAQTLLAALVLAELAKGVLRAIDYQRGL